MPAVVMTPIKRRFEQMSGTRRVWLLTVTVLMAVTALAFSTWRLPPIHSDFHLRWWHLAIAFYISELTVVHLRFRRDAHSFSMSELPLIVGLFLAAPVELIIGQVVGNALVLTLNRRQPLLKLTFNLAQFALQSTLAIATFRVIASFGDPKGLTGWFAALAATLTALTAADILINLAIRLTGGRLERRDILEVYALSALAATMNTGLAIIGMELLVNAPAAAALALVPPLVLFFAYRAYVSQRHERARLKLLYDATRDLHQSPQIESALVAAARHACSMFEAEFAEIVLFPSGPGSTAYRTAVGPGDRSEVMEPVGPGNDHPLWQLVHDNASGVLMTEPVAVIQGPSIKDAIAAPLSNSSGIVGTFLVANRLGNVSTFEAEDLSVLMTLASQVSVSLENGRLEDSLAALTELKEELRHQALHDSLTMLANRALFREKVEQSLAKAANGRDFSAVLFLDLDDFKVVNDSLGHAAGDILLKAVAGRLQAACRPGDTVARLGGDEFAVLVESITEHAEALAVAERIIEKLGAVFSIDGTKVNTRASIGIAFAINTRDPDQILRNADAAMYAAKRAGKGTYQVFESSMHAEVTRRLQLRGDLKEALAEDQLDLRYQPIVDLVSGRIMGVEALVRWHHPERGDVPPSQFIPFAEETGLIGQIGRRALREACRAARVWSRHDPDESPFRVSVNLSPVQLNDDGLVEEVCRTMLEEGITAESLVFEITETVMMQTSIRKLKELKELGVGLAIDDFGTGYSSLSYLDRLPVDIVKVDKSFTDRLGTGEIPPLVKTVVQLGEALGLVTVVEGIETFEQLKALRGLGCPRGQGFLFAHPMSAPVINALLDVQSTGSVVFPVFDELDGGHGHLRVVG